MGLKATFYQDMVKYILTGNFPANMSSTDKERFSKMADLYKVVDGVLFDCSDGDNNLKLVVTDLEDKLCAIRGCHVEKETGYHNSSEKTIQLAAAKYSWDGMMNDIANFVQKCQQCKFKLVPLRVDKSKRNAIWKMIEIEIFGPFDLNNDACIVQITDLTSKWISCVPISTHNPRDIAEGIMKHLADYGLPSAIRFTNQDDELAIRLIDEFEDELRNFVKTVEGIGDILKANTENPQASPQVVITRILEDDLFSFKEVDSLKSFLVKSVNELSDTICLFIIVGEESLLEEDLQTWHNDMLRKFIKLHSKDWQGRIEYFSHSLRSYLPTSHFARAPNTLMFLRNLDIFQNPNTKSIESMNVDGMDSDSDSSYMSDNTSFDEDFDKDDSQMDVDGQFVNIKKENGDDEGVTKNRPLVVCLQKNSDEAASDSHNFFKKKSHISNRMPCSVCPDVFFVSHDLMAIHLKFHVDGIEGFKCPYCGKIGPNWGGMYIHLCNHEESIPLIGTDHHPKSNYLCCPYCAKDFTARTRMLRHLKRLHLGQKNFECDVCGDEFEERKDYSKHMDSHQNNSTLYSCRDCAFTTQLFTNYQQHITNHESTEHYCPICQKTYPLRSALTSHMATLHGITSDEVKLKSEKGSHSKHQGSGTVLRCTKCSFKTRNRNNLKLHVKRIHNKTFECDYCNFTTQGEDNYKRHMDTFHNEEHRLPCPQCDYKAANAKSLSEHVKYQHDPEIPRLTCPYCNLTFKTLPLLKDHVPTHTGAEIYTCKVCLYKYKYRSNAYRHAKNKHPEVPLAEAIERAEIDRNGNPLPSRNSDSMDMLSRPEMDLSPESNMLLGSDVVVTTETAESEKKSDERGSNSQSSEHDQQAVVTLDPATGTMLYDGQTLTVNGNIVQFVNEDGTPLSTFDQTEGGVELLLLTVGEDENPIVEQFQEQS